MTGADIFAVGQVLTYEKVEYTLRKPNQYEQGQFQRWLEQRAHDAVDRSTADEPAKDRRHARIDTDAALGKYEWEGPFATEALWTPAGLAKIVSIVCQDQGVDNALAEKIVAAKIREVCAAILARASHDPLAMAPVLEALGLPSDWLMSATSESSSNNSATHPSEPSPTCSSSPDSPTIKSCSVTPSSEPPMG